MLNLNTEIFIPLLIYVTQDEFLTVMVSQMCQPFRWSQMRMFKRVLLSCILFLGNAPPIGHVPCAHKSILNIDPAHAFKSTLYRIPMKLVFV
jgi:hypothetical protein